MNGTRTQDMTSIHKTSAFNDTQKQTYTYIAMTQL